MAADSCSAIIVLGATENRYLGSRLDWSKTMQPGNGPTPRWRADASV